MRIHSGSHLGLSLASSLVFAFICLRITVGLFKREQVVFRA
jgi:hypothetical protein